MDNDIWVLMVEDDADLSEILKKAFSKQQKYRLVAAQTPEEALDEIQRRPFDIILLDIMLPNMDGINLCATIRKKLYCPIMFTSCLSDEETIVKAIQMGGDDYLVKPFSFNMLQAHMEMVLRRMRFGSGGFTGLIQIGDAALDTQRHTIQRRGVTEYLTPTEFNLLMFFIQNREIIVSYEQVFQFVWGKPSYGDLRTLFSHIRHLRQKIEVDPSQPRHLVTVPHAGYIFFVSKGEMKV